MFNRHARTRALAQQGSCCPPYQRPRLAPPFSLDLAGYCSHAPRAAALIQIRDENARVRVNQNTGKPALGSPRRPLPASSSARLHLLEQHYRQCPNRLSHARPMLPRRTGDRTRVVPETSRDYRAFCDTTLGFQARDDFIFPSQTDHTDR